MPEFTSSTQPLPRYLFIYHYYRASIIGTFVGNWTAHKRMEIDRQIQFLSRQEDIDWPPVVYLIAIGEDKWAPTDRDWLVLSRRLATIIPDNYAFRLVTAQSSHSSASERFFVKACSWNRQGIASVHMVPSPFSPCFFRFILHTFPVWYRSLLMKQDKCYLGLLLALTGLNLIAMNLCAIFFCWISFGRCRVFQI